MRLSQALKRLSASDYRNLLRQAVGERADVPTSHNVLTAAVSPNSYAVITGKKVPPTYSGLRDRLGISVLLALVTHQIQWDDVMLAFKDPKTHGRMIDGQYACGWPAALTPSDAASLMWKCKRGEHDEFAGLHYSTFKDEPPKTTTTVAPATTTTTEKTMDFDKNSMGIDDVYETFVVLAATKLSILKTQSEANGFGIDESKLLHDAKTVALGLIGKHFGADKRKGVEAMVAVDDKTDFTKVAGTDNALADAAFRSIVTSDTDAFKVAVVEDDAEPVTEVMLSITDPKQRSLFDLVLSQATGGAFANTDDLINRVKKVSSKAVKLAAENDRLKKALTSRPAITVRSTASTAAEKVLPSGIVTSIVAQDVFLHPGSRAKNPLLKFNTPAFDWGGANHPEVPEYNPNYIFKPTLLLKFLMALEAGQNIWIYGHTGCGKTDFVKQACARLNWPMFQLNLDSEITRMDMIGRETLVAEKGVTVSRFVDGIIPQAMQLQGHGAVLLVDEVSYGRPDVMYVFQRVLQDKLLAITEDGNRKVVGGSMFRVVATCNTRGQGDEFGVYQGARPQSAAFLDRFSCWLSFDYLPIKDEVKLLLNTVPGLIDVEAQQIASFANEVRTSFKSGHIYQTMSPRTSMAMAQDFIKLTPILDGDKAQAIQAAAEATILERCNDNDKAVVRGLYDRCVTMAAK